MVEINGVEWPMDVNCLWAVLKYEELTGKKFGSDMSVTEMAIYIYSGLWAAQKVENKELPFSYEDFIGAMTLSELGDILASANPTQPQPTD